MDLVSVYRDAIAVAAGAPGQLVNEEIRGDVEQLVRASDPGAQPAPDRLRSSRPASRCSSSTCRPPLALESMMLALKVPDGAAR